MTALLSLAFALVLMGVAVRRGWRPASVLSLGAAVLFAGFLLELFWPGSGGQSGLAAWRSDFEQSLTASLAVYRQWGWDEKDLQRTAQLIRAVFGEAIFGWLATAAVAVAGIGYRSLRRRVAGPDGVAKPLLPFGALVLPDALIWGLLIALLLLVLGSRVSGPATGVAWNVLVFLGALYFFGGLTVAAFWMDRQKLPRWVQFGLLLAVVLLPMLIVLLAVVGVFDTWWDWRRLRTLR